MSIALTSSSFRHLSLERLETRSMLAGDLLAVELSERGSFDRNDSAVVGKNSMISNRASGANLNAHFSNGRRETFVESQKHQSQMPLPLPLRQNWPLETQPFAVTVYFEILHRGGEDVAASVAASSPQFFDGPEILGGVLSSKVVVSANGISATDPAGIATSFALSFSIPISTNTAIDKVFTELYAPETLESLSSDLSVVEPGVSNHSAAELPNLSDSGDNAFGSGRVVELWPLINQSLEFEAVQSDQEWELGQDVLSRLKLAVIWHSDDAVLLSDKFEEASGTGHGGMVAVHSIELPVSGIVIDDSNIEIDLESTVTLYSSAEFDLVSVVPPPVDPISDETLDSIMTTLGKLTELEDQPLETRNTIRFSVIAYPAAVLAMTGGAISARLRSKRREFQDMDGGDESFHN